MWWSWRRPRSGTIHNPAGHCKSLRLSDAEMGVHDVLKRHGFSCNLAVGHVDLGPRELRTFPYIRFSTWLVFLGIQRIARQLCGVSSLNKMRRVLPEFWHRYESVNGGHDVFGMARAGNIDLRMTIPYFSHSDEGRSYKKEAIWVFSLHGAIGRGTKKYLGKKKHLAPLKRNQMGLNFVSPSWSWQFLFATMLRQAATDNPDAIEKLVSIFAEDAAELATQGIEVEGQRLWLVHLGTKGDLPALGKLGGFKRSFLQTPRGARSKKRCLGICHRCLGGQEGDEARGIPSFPFEDLSPNPCWEVTMDTVAPWVAMPVVMRGMPINPQKKSEFFHFDLWHIFHLGVAKHWLGSSFVVLAESDLPALAPFTSIETKFGFITEKYQEFCRGKKCPMWITEINRDTLLWPQSSATPLGKWNKGSASATIMLFLSEFCKQYVTGHTADETLLLIVSWLSQAKVLPLVSNNKFFPYFPYVKFMIIIIICYVLFWISMCSHFPSIPFLGLASNVLWGWSNKTYEPDVWVLVQLWFLDSQPQSRESCEVYVSLFGVVSATCLPVVEGG